MLDILSLGVMGLGTYASYLVSKQIVENFSKEGKVLKEIGLEGYEVDSKTKKPYGFELILRVPNGGHIEQVEECITKIEKAYACKVEVRDIPFTNKIKLDLITRDFENLEKDFVELGAYQLLMGYDYKSENLIVDMKETTHLLVTGLSGQGKTGLIRFMVKNILANDKADVVLFNGYSDDFEDLPILNVKDHGEIKKYIKELLDGEKRDRPLYIIFEELGKVKDKELITLITNVLQYARHKNAYLIGIIQRSTAEELKFKSLFVARLTFKQLDDSSYKVVLGCNVEDRVKKREFYLLTDDLYKGRTYNFPW